MTRWCSRTAWGQEFWLILSQWVWNVRLCLGHQLHPTPMCMTEFAPAQICVPEASPSPTLPGPSYGPPRLARSAQMGGLPGTDFLPQPDGTLRCPAGSPLYLQERRAERDGVLRVLYAARIGHCRPCPLRELCQGYGARTTKPRRVSAVLHPLPAVVPELKHATSSPATLPIIWGDWQRRSHRREVVKLLRHQRIDIQLPEPSPPAQPLPAHHLSRAERAHYGDRVGMDPKTTIRNCSGS